MKDLLSQSLGNNQKNLAPTIGGLFRNLQNRVARNLQRINIQGDDLISGKDLHLFFNKKIEKKGIIFGLNVPISKEISDSILAQNIQFFNCDFSARNDVSVNFTNSQFYNCTFDVNTFRNSSFVGARFHNCTFYTSTFLECDISDTQWRDNIYKSGILDFLCCKMKNLDCSDKNSYDSISIAGINIQIDPHTSSRVTFCTDFEGKEGCWSQGSKKRVVGTMLDFGNTFSSVPILVFLSRDGSEGGNWKIAFIVDREVVFPLTNSRLHPGIFYSIPNSFGELNISIRERFLNTVLVNNSLNNNNYSKVYFGGSIDLSDIIETSHEIVFRPFRPVSIGTPGFSEYVTESFRKLQS